MSLARYINNLYKTYKKPLAIFVLVFFMYKILNYYSFIYEGYSSRNQCTGNKNCAQCVNNTDANTNVPCWWNNKKGCSAFYDKGYSRTCSTPNPNPSTCENIKNCKNCVGNNNCFWGDRDQKCSSFNKLGYGKICSGYYPDPTCPKCDECPKLTLLKTPTFITQP
jgi:hypothetical protein